MKKRGIASLMMILILANSCAERSKQELRNPNEGTFKHEAEEIKLLSDEKIKLNEKALFKLVLQDSNLKIKKAYFDCDNQVEMQIDKKNQVIRNCQKELFIHEDTIIIQFTPTTIGVKEFSGITVLAINERDSLSIHNGNFEYLVIE